MVLAFSMIPCADGASFASDDVKYELTQTDPQGNDQNHADACSPFCICACCAGFSEVTMLTLSVANLISHQPQHQTYIPQGLYGISLSIWQPPRLV